MYPVGQGRDGGFARIVGMDPAADWLLGPALQDFSPPEESEALVPLLLRVDAPDALDVLARLIERGGGDTAKPMFVVVDFQDRRTLVPRAGQYVAALASVGFLEALADGADGLAPLRDGAKRIELGLPMPAAALAATEARDPFAGLEPPPVSPRDHWPCGTVVIGVIDDGIAFAHERFRTAAGTTRFEAFWNQDGRPRSPSVPYGIELGRGGIDALLLGNATAGLAEEDTIYRLAGLANFNRLQHKSVAYRAAHGTHVLDLAAGPEPGRPPPADRPIIGVQLRVASTARQSGKGLEWDVRNAFHYILDRALRLTAPGAAPLPVVINFSYATHSGPHDGTSSLEEAVEQAIADAARDHGQTVRVVLPAGNTHLSRCHAAIALGNGGGATLGLRLQPDDRTLSAMTFWLPPSGGTPPSSSRVALSITAPDGATATLHEGVGSGFELRRNGELFCFGAYAFAPPLTRRGCFLIGFMPTARLLPTASPALADRVAPSGLWTVRLAPENTGLARDERIEAWIERDDVVYGYPRRGRQPYFEKACYRRFDELGRELADPPLPPCEVQRRSMISGIATGATPVVAGGMLRQELRVAGYSAGGPVVTPEGGPSRADERKPDLLAISEDSKVHAGVLAAGARSGSVVAIGGTSVAAPRLTRWIANELARGNTGDRDAAIAMAEAQEAALPPPPPPRPPDGPADLRSGWGRAPGIGAHSGAGRRYWWP